MISSVRRPARQNPSRVLSSRIYLKLLTCAPWLDGGTHQHLVLIEKLNRSWRGLTFRFLSKADMRYICVYQTCFMLVSAQQGRALWSINIPQLPTRGAARTQSGMTSVKALKGPICNTNKWACLVFCLRGLARPSCNYGNPGCRVALLIGWQLQQHH